VNNFGVELDDEFTDKYFIYYTDNDGFTYVDNDIAEQLHIPLEKYEDVLRKSDAIVIHNALSQWFEDTRFLFRTETQAQNAINMLKTFLN
jgi:hypothetical protein